MRLALDAAHNSAKNREVPVGAVIVNKRGLVISVSGNRVREFRDPTAHAEILAIRNACALYGSERIPGTSIYVTLEPCNMCLQAIINARIEKLYYGAPNNELEINEKTRYRSITPNGAFPLEIYPDISREASTKKMKKFFGNMR